MLKAGMIRLLAGVCFFAMASHAFAQPAAVTEKLADFKSASQQLKELYDKAKALGDEIDAATKKQQAAETALKVAMQGLDAESEQDGKLMETAYTAMQAANQSVANAELETHNSAAVANEEADEAQ